MKLALSHDYLTQLGGAEKVLESLQELFPQSPIFVLIHNKKKTGDIFPPHKVNTSWLQHMPFSKKRHQLYLTLMPHAVEIFKLSEYDIVLSSASSFAKGIRVPKETLHICYCHTPTRYLWHDRNSYVEELSYNKLVKKIIPYFLDNIRNWDIMAARRVDYFIANSYIVKNRINKYYHRDSTVIYPPVETDKFKITDTLGDYYLIGGRLVPYKKYDLAIKAFNKLGIKLKIFGDGPDRKRLQKMARENIEFLGAVTELKKQELYSQCLAFLYPQEEDFGITAIEAMASGRPVIAYRKGGATETIIDGITGKFFDEQNWESLSYTVIHFDPYKFNPKKIKEHAEQFSSARFQREIASYINSKWQDHQIERIFRIKGGQKSNFVL